MEEERDGGMYTSLARERPIIFAGASRDLERVRRSVPRPLAKVRRVNRVERTRSAPQSAAKKKKEKQTREKKQLNLYLCHRLVHGSSSVLSESISDVATKDASSCCVSASERI